MCGVRWERGRREARGGIESGKEIEDVKKEKKRQKEREIIIAGDLGKEILEEARGRGRSKRRVKSNREYKRKKWSNKKKD